MPFKFGLIMNDKVLSFRNKKFLFLAIIVSTMYLEGFICSQNVIIWQSTQKLHYKDFEALPPNSSEFLAETSTDIKTQITFNNRQVCYKATTRFKKNESWFIGINPEILMHEQIHFDITELFTRKLRRDFSNLEFSKSNYQAKIDSLYIANNIELNNFQDQYDSETDHSKNDLKQEQWQKLIVIKLKETEAFADTVYCFQFQ